MEFVNDYILEQAKEYCKASNKTAAEFAREIGESERTIQRYFKEHHLPKKRGAKIEGKIMELLFVGAVTDTKQMEMPIEDSNDDECRFHVIAVKEPEEQVKNITVGLTSGAMELIKKVSYITERTQKDIASEMINFAYDHIKYDRR